MFAKIIIFTEVNVSKSFGINICFKHESQNLKKTYRELRCGITGFEGSHYVKNIEWLESRIGGPH